MEKINCNQNEGKQSPSTVDVSTLNFRYSIDESELKRKLILAWTYVQVDAVLRWLVMIVFVFVIFMCDFWFIIVNLFVNNLLIKLTFVILTAVY